MSYCRNDGGETSDVYVIKHVGGFLACYCCLGDNQHDTPQGMIDHLAHHRARGDKVPERAFERLRAERDGKPYKTDVQLALEEFNFNE